MFRFPPNPTLRMLDGRFMKRFIAFSVVVGALITGHAHAERMTLTGSDFLSACSKSESDWIGFCHGYVQGVFDSSPSGEICAPPGTTRAKLVGMIVQEIEEDPDLRSTSAAPLVRIILQKAYPCQ